MIEIHLKIFKFTLDLLINCNCDKHKSFSVKSKEDAEMQEASLTFDNSCLNIEHLTSENADISEDEKSDIFKQAEKFSDELKNIDINGLYDIDDNSELPRYGISSDVEIITESYEKEQEDIIEGRR